MTADEILDAVKTFIDEPIPHGDDEHSWVIELLPEWTTMRMVGVARVSPAWIRHKGISAMNEVTHKASASQ